MSSGINLLALVFDGFIKSVCNDFAGAGLFGTPLEQRLPLLDLKAVLVR